MKNVKNKGGRFFNFLKTRKETPIWLLIVPALFLSLILSVLLYQVGLNDGYENKNREIEQQQAQEQMQEQIDYLMEKDFNELAEHAGKLFLAWFITHQWVLKLFLSLVIFSLIIKVIA